MYVQYTLYKVFMHILLYIDVYTPIFMQILYFAHYVCIFFIFFLYYRSFLLLLNVDR